MRHDVMRRGGHVAMQDGHAFGAPGTAAGVQHKSYVVARRSGSCSSTRGAGNANRSGGIHLQGKHRHAASRGRFARALGAVGRAKQDLGPGVFQIESHLILAIAGIKWCGRSRHRRCQKAHDSRQTVGKIGRDAVPSRDAQRRQRIRHGRYVFPQRIVGQANAGLRQNDGRRFPGSHLDELQESLWIGHHNHDLRSGWNDAPCRRFVRSGCAPTLFGNPNRR